MIPFPVIPKSKVYCIEIGGNENGEKTMTFPDEMGSIMKYWVSGDKTYWIDHGNGNWSIYVHKPEEVPEDKGSIEQAIQDFKNDFKV